MPGRKILDDFQNQIVHIVVGHEVYHVAVAGDGMSAWCLETHQDVTGATRRECLERMADMLRAMR